MTSHDSLTLEERRQFYAQLPARSHSKVFIWSFLSTCLNMWGWYR